MRILIIIFIVTLSNYCCAQELTAKCNNFFETYEEKFDLPMNILSSVSITETGKWNKKQKALDSWPWSVNHSGKSYFFDSKNEAIIFVTKLIKQGYKNIDVGCMQVNLKHHPYAFKDLHEAFDPNNNIAYAAKLIKRHYVNSASWVRAIAQYHSGEKDRGIKYANKVINIWKNSTYHKETPRYKLAAKYHSSQKIFRVPTRNPLRLKNEILAYNIQSKKG